MNRILLFLAIMLIATSSAWSKGVIGQATVEASNHPDGVLFQMKGPSADLQISVSGPGNIAYSQTYAAADSVFMEVNRSNGGKLADGLYKYEARVLPAVRFSREESMAMHDRNVLVGKSAAKYSPVSGTFRVVNGSIVDASVSEFDAARFEKEKAQ